jgi:hypothetical protein
MKTLIFGALVSLFATACRTASDRNGASVATTIPQSQAIEHLVGTFWFTPGPGGASQSMIVREGGAEQKVRWSTEAIGQRLLTLSGRKVEVDGYHTTVYESSLPGQPSSAVQVLMITHLKSVVSSVEGVYSVLPGPGGHSKPVVTRDDGSVVEIRAADHAVEADLSSLSGQSVSLEGYETTVMESSLAGLPPQPIKVFLVTTVRKLFPGSVVTLPAQN